MQSLFTHKRPSSDHCSRSSDAGPHRQPSADAGDFSGLSCADTARRARRRARACDDALGHAGPAAIRRHADHQYPEREEPALAAPSRFAICAARPIRPRTSSGSEAARLTCGFAAFRLRYRPGIARFCAWVRKKRTSDQCSPGAGHPGSIPARPDTVAAYFAAHAKQIGPPMRGMATLRPLHSWSVLLLGSVMTTPCSVRSIQLQLAALNPIAALEFAGR